MTLQCYAACWLFSMLLY